MLQALYGCKSDPTNANVVALELPGEREQAGRAACSTRPMRVQGHQHLSRCELHIPSAIAHQRRKAGDP